MLVLPQTVKIKWTREYKWYTNKGYIFTNVGDEFEVNVQDLKKSQRVAVKVQCDYCGKEIDKYYVDYLNQRKFIVKDCCKKCYPQKVREVTLKKYGVESINQIEEVKEKKKETFLEHYGEEFYARTDVFKNDYKQLSLEKRGVDHPLKDISVRNKITETLEEKYGVDNAFKSEEIKDKIKQFNLDNYGVEYYTQTDEFQEKRKQTCLERYGYENPLQNEDVKQKSKETNLERYGVPVYSQTEEFLEKYKQTCLLKYGVEFALQDPGVREKGRQSLYKNGTGISSTQQRYICNLVGGELNYPASKSLVDIAFVQDKIYLEYDGGGHDLSVKAKLKTKEEFKKRERRRWYALNREGWKSINIVSRQDWLPSDDKIIEIMDFAFTYLESNHSWIKFDIDKNKIICSQFEIEFDYGVLSKVKEVD